MGLAASHHNGDDDLSIATWQGNTFSCNSAMTLEPCGSEKSESAGLKRSVLKIHRPDRDQKCLLDSSEVYSALQVQAEKILSRDGLLVEEIPWEPELFERDDTDDGSSRWGGISVTTGVLSDAAPSEMTTATNATRPAANIGYAAPRRKSRKKFSVLGSLQGANGMSSHIIDDKDENEDDDDARSIRAPSGQRRKRGHQGTLEEDLATASDNIQRIHQRKEEAAQRRNDVFEKYAGLFASCIAPGDEVQIRREESMSVLHLKMKAHLGRYYKQRYLPMFSKTSLPHDWNSSSEKSDTMIVSDDSEDSSSCAISQVIEFGSIPSSTPIHSAIDGSVFMDMSITGSLGLVPRHSHGSRKVSPSKHKQKSPDHYIVLVNRRSGIPLAVCALKTQDGLPIVRIYATKQRVAGQRAAATTEQLGLDWASSLPLYAWAEIVTEGMHPNPIRFSVYMASGSEGRFSAVPSYKASFLNEGSPAIYVVGRTDKDIIESGCALLTIEMEEGSKTDEDLSFQIDIAQGIDPGLLICLTAVIDEVIEKSMRLQYHQQATAKERRPMYEI